MQTLKSGARWYLGQLQVDALDHEEAHRGYCQLEPAAAHQGGDKCANEPAGARAHEALAIQPCAGSSLFMQCGAVPR